MYANVASQPLSPDRKAKSTSNAFFTSRLQTIFLVTLDIEVNTKVSITLYDFDTIYK